MSGFTKLFSDILHSTVWRTDMHVKVVWITMLAMSDRHGQVLSSIPGLADMAKVSLDQCLDALKTLSSPDEYSRTKDFEGRRVAEIDGGWLLLNYEKYRAKKDEEEQRLRAIAKSRRYRESLVTEPVTITENHPKAEAEAEAEAETTTTSVSPNGDTTHLACPFSQILRLYHDLLPELPRCVKLTDARRGMIRQRWSQDLEDLDEWKKYFEIVKKSDFLMGRSKPRDSRRPFRADLIWLCKAENICKVMEGKYHG
jgi:hypothetical protein